jgi:thiosulfate dehydrogenase [quinone] large subunit
MQRTQVATSTPDPILLLAVLRLTLGALFVWVFFENLGKGLYTPDGYASLIRYYAEKGTAPSAWKAVMRFMADGAALAAPAQAVIELGLGVLLLAGLATRLVALAAFAWLTSLWVSEWGTAWIWELLVPMVVAACLALGGAGRRFGVDAALARRYPAVPLW